MHNIFRFLPFSAGWIGNDAVTPIVGEHDPYIHVYGRVSGYHTVESILSKKELSGKCVQG